MIGPLQHQLELTLETAILYLSGSFQRSDAVRLHQLITGLPERVRTLRLDLRAIGEIDQTTIDTVRPVLRHWRTQRGGSIGLSVRTRHIVATYGESEAPGARDRKASCSMCDALTATYL
jgi:ABC-type transporter Mla MlaB component